MMAYIITITVIMCISMGQTVNDITEDPASLGGWLNLFLSIGTVVWGCVLLTTL